MQQIFFCFQAIEKKQNTMTKWIDDTSWKFMGFQQYMYSIIISKNLEICIIVSLQNWDHAYGIFKKNLSSF